MDTPAPRHGRYAAVDSLRVCAMTLVIAQHCDLLPIGWIGVWIFFVISGFVVTTSILGGHAGTHSPAIRVRNFYFRRIARIVPLHACYVGLFVLACLAFARSSIAGQVLTLATFTCNFYAPHGDRVFPISHLWTISVEMQFYLLVGAALILLPARQIRRVMVALLILPVAMRVLYSLSAQAAGVPGGAIQYWESHVSIFQFDAFAAGCLLSLYRGVIGRRTANAGLAMGFGSLIAAVCAYAVVNHVTRGASGLSAFKDILSGAAASGQLREALIYVPVVLLSVGCVASAITDRSVGQTLLTWKWLPYIGQCSYSGYMAHLVVIRLLRAGLAIVFHVSDAGARSTMVFAERLGLFGAATVLTIALSIPMFEWIEQPLARQTRRLLRF